MPWLHVLSRRFGYPAALVIAMLQRSPIVRFAGWAQECVALLPASVLRGGAVLATLGAIDTLAGATVTIQSSLNNKNAGTSLSASVGTPVSQVLFGINVSSDAPESWTLQPGSTLPPGVTFGDLSGSPALTGPGSFDTSLSQNSFGYAMIRGTPTQSGKYTLQMVAYEYPGSAGNGNNAANTAPSFTFTINVTGGSITTPTVTTQPQSQTVTAGSSVSFTAGFSDLSAAVQWKKGGVAISGATSSTLTLASAQLSDGGSYTATATNSAGSVTTNAAVLTVNPAPTPPAVTIQPVGVTVLSGGTAVLTATATGATSYQWYHGSTAISGATSPTLLLSNVTVGNNTGNYFLSAANAAGSVQTNTVAVNALASSTPGRLINLSVGTAVPAGQMLTLGFIVGGNGATAQETVLARADGPTLASFGIANVMADPNLNVVFTQGGAKVAGNDNWGSNASAVIAADNVTGAFALNQNSLDAALVTTLSPGLYSAQVTNNVAAAGFGIGEVYDDTATYSATIPHLTNLSTLFNVPAGGSLTGGFVIGGSTAKTVLIRAMGPALSALGVSGVMSDPTLTLNETNGANIGVVATNAGWGGDQQVQSVATQVGAFAFASNSSLDSALIYTLQPGVTYTATTTSASGGSGNVIVEVYEVP